MQVNDEVKSQKSVLSFMASLCVVAKEIRAAEGYLLEMLAITTFSDKFELATSN